jgi:hypothetical protein
VFRYPGGDNIVGKPPASTTVNMTTALAPAVWTAVDLAERFGPIPLDRIITPPAPGMATEEDAIELTERKIHLCELVDGILVEKAMGSFESMLAVELAVLIRNFVKSRKLGTVLGADGMLKLGPGLIRIPDVAFPASLAVAIRERCLVARP